MSPHRDKKCFSLSISAGIYVTVVKVGVMPSVCLVLLILIVDSQEEERIIHV